MAGTWDFGNFRFWKNVRVSFFKNPQNMCFENVPLCPVLFFSKTRKKMVFEKIQIFEQLPGSKIPLLATHKIISHIWEDDLEKLITTNPIWDFFTETFDLLSAGQFENLVRRGGYGFYLVHKFLLLGGCRPPDTPLFLGGFQKSLGERVKPVHPFSDKVFERLGL